MTYINQATSVAGEATPKKEVAGGSNSTTATTTFFYADFLTGLHPSKAFTWTEFPDRHALRYTRHEHTWPELVNYLRVAGPYPSKDASPLLSLCSYDTKRSKAHSLRHGANVLSVNGIEGDYDGEVMTMGEAVSTLERHGIRAALYPSASATPEKPRWRVLCPLATPSTPNERERLVARLNGVLGGVLAGESFTLSQSYYFGRVNDAWEVVCTFDDPDEGRCLDELPELDALAIFKRGASQADDGYAPPVEVDLFAERVRSLGRKLRTGDGRRDLLKTWLASRSARGMGLSDLKLSVRGVAAEFFDLADPVDWQDIDTMAADFVRKDYRSEVDLSGFLAGLSDAGAAWPKPLPLIDSITPEPYPLDALPTTMREAVLEVQGFAQAPMAMVATSALSALSMAAQALHDVKRAEKLTGPISLFTLVLADSGERKTTCDDFFMPAIRQWQRAQEEAMHPQVESHEAALDAWNAEREGIVAKIKELSKNGKPTDALKRDLADLQAEKPEPPRVPRLIYSDITPEELGYQLAKRWPSAAITASEGGTVLGGHSMTGDSAMRNMARLNDLWSGQEISSDRRTSESWVARGARLTVGLQVQESTLRAFFDKSAGLARGTGFLARFLVAWPQSTQGMRLFKDAPDQWPKLAAYHQRIERILSVPTPMDDDGALTPSLIPLSAQAKALWVEYHDEVETRLAVGGDYADVRDVASKSADNAARLAALFHIFEHGGGGAIGLDAMEAGCMVAAWYLQESRRFFGEIAVPIEMADAMRVIRWAVEYGRSQGGTVATRDLQRLGPARSKERLDAALRELQDHHHVRLRTEGKRKLVEINPALLEATAP